MQGKSELMKYLFYIAFLVLSFSADAQNKKTVKILANTALLERTVFETKDSATLEKLFAKTLTYGHSSGKIETREEAIKGIVNNKSVYTKNYSVPSGYNVFNNGDSIMVKHKFIATEKKADGTEGKLDLTIELAWIKEKGDWKLARRQATKNQ